MVRKLWFKRKTYGWGWYPSTWEGWLVIAVYLAISFAAIAYVSALKLSETQSAYVVLVVMTINTLILISISYLKGEPPRWQWGEEKKGKKDADAK
ncbi:MAG: hypothetical protein QY318_00155 [Candidatus Dojkabacteria bacterium]|nr:MAG: hypothetical protein QY318_00155 [Candidatus Dojkabacteria bacterium]